MGRRPIGDAAMTAAERQRMRRARLQGLQPAQLLPASQSTPAPRSDDMEVPGSVQTDTLDADERNTVRLPDGNCGTARPVAPTDPVLAESDVSREVSQPDLLALDAESIAARILEALPLETADQIARAIDQRLMSWRVGSFSAGLPLARRG
jgi:hypothetical protein